MGKKYNKAAAQKQRQRDLRKNEITYAVRFWNDHLSQLAGKVDPEMLETTHQLLHLDNPQFGIGQGQIRVNPDLGKWDLFGYLEMAFLEPMTPSAEIPDELLTICAITRQELSETDLIMEYGSLEMARLEKELEQLNPMELELLILKLELINL